MPNFISEDQIEQAMVQRLQHLCGYDTMNYIAARRKNGGGHCGGRTAVSDLSRGRYSGWLSGCWGRFDPPGFGELTKRGKYQGSRNWAGCPMGKKLNYVLTKKLRKKLRNKIRITPVISRNEGTKPALRLKSGL